MKRQIRCGVFETNSSSVHAITMCTELDYHKWRNGELIYDRWEEKLVPISDKTKKETTNGDYLTYEQFNDYECLEYETFSDSFTTPDGENVIAFGYYGHD